MLETFHLAPFEEYWAPKYSHPHANLKHSMRGFLRYRNGVAHGGDISSEEKVTQPVYSKYKELVGDLMAGVQDRMIDGLKNKTYLTEISNGNPSQKPPYSLP
jgi:hypothetical protein